MHDDQWHFISLKMEENKVNLLIDSKLENEMIERNRKVKQTNNKDITSNRKGFILIGGMNGIIYQNMSNFIGSLQQIFINDNFDVIQALQHY